MFLPSLFLSLFFLSGSAKIPEDFDLRNNTATVVFRSGSIEATIPDFIINNDKISESTEEFTVMMVLNPTLSTASAIVAPDTATVIIQDDDCELDTVS